MKRFVILFLWVFVIIGTLAACGNGEDYTGQCYSCKEVVSNDYFFCPFCGESLLDSNGVPMTTSAIVTEDDWNDTDDTTCEINGSNDTNILELNESEFNSLINISAVRTHADDSGEIEVCIDWKNESAKVIKYMWFNLELYNRVGDLISCVTGEYDMWLCQTGPIPQGKGMYAGHPSSISDEERQDDVKNGWAGVWHTVGYNSTVGSLKIVSIKIEYIDGTICTVKDRSIFEKLEYIFFKS